MTGKTKKLIADLAIGGVLSSGCGVLGGIAINAVLAHPTLKIGYKVTGIVTTMALSYYESKTVTKNIVDWLEENGLLDDDKQNAEC